MFFSEIINVFKRHMIISIPYTCVFAGPTVHTIILYKDSKPPFLFMADLEQTKNDIIFVSCSLFPEIILD